MILHVSSSTKNQYQAFSNLKYYVLSAAKRIVEDIEVKHMIQAARSSRTRGDHQCLMTSLYSSHFIK